MKPDTFPVKSRFLAAILVNTMAQVPGERIRVGEFEVMQWSPSAAWVQLWSLADHSSLWMLSERVDVSEKLSP